MVNFMQKISGSSQLITYYLPAMLKLVQKSLNRACGFPDVLCSHENGNYAHPFE
jgi:hypothetical protein